MPPPLPPPAAPPAASPPHALAPALTRLLARLAQRCGRLPAGLAPALLLLLLAAVFAQADHDALRAARWHAQDVAAMSARQMALVYEHVLAERRLLLEEGLQQLEQTAGMARRLADFALQDAARQGLPPRETQDQAGTLALALIDHVFLEPGLLCFVYDDRITALTYPELALRGLDLSPYRDRRGRSLLRTLREDAQRWGRTSAVFDWKARGAARMTQHLGLAVDMPAFNWTLAVFLDADSMQRRERALRQREAKALLALLRTTHDAANAVYCLMDGRGRLLDAPVTGLPATHRLVQGVLTTNMLAQVEIQSRLLVAALAGAPVELDDLPGDAGPVQVTGVQHPALDWTLVRLAPVHTPASHWLWIVCVVGAGMFLLTSSRSLQGRKDAS